MTKKQRARQRRRENRAIMVIYGLVIIAFLSMIFFCWWGVFRTTMYYSIPYKIVEEWQV